jgi:hypothetical protein
VDLEHVLDDERRHRTHDLADRDQDRVQRRQAVVPLVLADLAALQAIAVEADVPIRHLVEEGEQLRHDVVELVLFADLEVHGAHLTRTL